LDSRVVEYFQKGGEGIEFPRDIEPKPEYVLPPKPTVSHPNPDSLPNPDDADPELELDVDCHLDDEDPDVLGAYGEALETITRTKTAAALSRVVPDSALQTSNPFMYKDLSDPINPRELKFEERAKVFLDSLEKSASSSALLVSAAQAGGVSSAALPPRHPEGHPEAMSFSRKPGVTGVSGMPASTSQPPVNTQDGEQNGKNSLLTLDT